MHINQPLNVLIGNYEESINTLISEMVKEVIQDKFDLTILTCSHSENILLEADENPIDLFIIIINNIIFPSASTIQDSVENPLQLLAHIKTKYQKPIIALSGWSDNSTLSDEVKYLSDFFFLLPFEPDSLGEAIEKCLNILPVQRNC